MTDALDLPQLEKLADRLLEVASESADAIPELVARVKAVLALGEFVFTIPHFETGELTKVVAWDRVRRAMSGEAQESVDYPTVRAITGDPEK